MATRARTGRAPAAEATTAPRLDSTKVSERTIPGLFLRRVAELGDGILIRHHDGEGWREVTWNAFGSLALRTAAALVGAGVKAGDHVLLMGENRIEWLYCDLGIQMAGAITVPVYPSSTPETVAQIAENSGAVLAIVSNAKNADKVQVTGPLRQVARMDEAVAEWIEAEPAADSLAEVFRRLEALSPDDVATVIYTSGTTGAPKGVVIAHRSPVDMALSSLQVFDISPADESLSFLPYSHVFERFSGVVVAMASGASGWLSRGMDRLAEDLQAARPTIMVGVPRIYEKVYALVWEQVRQQPARRQRIFEWALAVGRRHSQGERGPVLAAQHALARRLVLAPLHRRLTGGRLRFFVSGGAALNPEIEAFFWALGVKILQGWGMTETSSGATSNTENSHRFGTVGKPLPGVEIKIEADGELLCKSPGNMLEYYRNPVATAETLDAEGWLHTGDIGEIDADGFLKITDRKKDLIKTAGGKYVAPQPIEAELMSDPAIERAVVIGEGRPYCVALIVPDFAALASREGITGTPEELITDPRIAASVQRRVDQVNGGLGSWESIKYFALLPHDFTEETGELTPSLKVKRKVVSEQRAEIIESLYAGRKRPAGAEH